MLHIPILRRGRPYHSADVGRLAHYRTKKPVAEISQANPGLIRRDLLRQDFIKQIHARFTVSELTAIAMRAAEHFLQDKLPVDDSTQTPQDYIEQVSATTGLPHVMVRRNMRKIHGVMSRIENVLSGLTRRLDLRVLDDGYGDLEGQAVSFFPRADSLGVVLPSNSPGVHSLWIPAFALKTPLVLKPGSAEPWTPYRIVQALMRAGAPAEIFGYYPSSHAGAGEILRQCGRGMVFGDVASTKGWQNDPRMEVHGPGYSKIFIGEDEIDRWERYLDVLADSIVHNSGRSCVNASGIWVPRHADAIAAALAERFARIEPLPAEDENAQIAPFADPNIAGRINLMIESEMTGARALPDRERLVDFDDARYLLPTVVRCDAEHALANREFLFPFASVVEIPQESVPQRLGPTLVLTAITNDAKLQQRLLASPLIGRLNFGPVPTNHIVWDQPHEGNLFDHLYARRAFQRAAVPV
jgi:acyl-CoA reductase-like NAD-dependent aldehyde dehydrogenase